MTNNNNISDLYGHLETLIRQYTYLKSEIDTSLSGKANASHPHDTDDITDDSAYTNLGTTANSTQSQINSAINTALGDIHTLIYGTGEE